MLLGSQERWGKPRRETSVERQEKTGHIFPYFIVNVGRYAGANRKRACSTCQKHQTSKEQEEGLSNYKVITGCLPFYWPDFRWFTMCNNPFLPVGRSVEFDPRWLNTHCVVDVEFGPQCRIWTQVSYSSSTTTTTITIEPERPLWRNSLAFVFPLSTQIVELVAGLSSFQLERKRNAQDGTSGWVYWNEEEEEDDEEKNRAKQRVGTKLFLAFIGLDLLAPSSSDPWNTHTVMPQFSKVQCFVFTSTRFSGGVGKIYFQLCFFSRGGFEVFAWKPILSPCGLV